MWRRVLDFSRGRRRHGVRAGAAGRVARSEGAAAAARRSTLAVEQYGRIWRTLEKNIPVTLQMDIDNRFYDDDLNAFNIVARTAGTDKADEVVMLGAHFDSWHTGTGATDNAAGSAVMLEAMRILKVSGVKLRRTVRIGLWGGEEEGLLGSREYVKEHFGDPETMQLKPEHAKFSGYFNVDNGTGVIRGVYLQGNEAVAPIFELDGAVQEPRDGHADHPQHRRHRSPVVRRGRVCRDFSSSRTRSNTTSRTHHSNMDVYERIQPNDMMRNAVIVASFVYERRQPRRQAAAQAAAEGGSRRPARSTGANP